MSLIVYPTKEEFLQQLYSKSKSYGTVERAKTAFVSWSRFLEERKYEEQSVLELLRKSQTQPEAYIFLNSYVAYLNKKGLAANTVKIHFYFMKKWFRANGIRVNNEDVKQFVTFPKHTRELRVALTHEIISKLVEAAPPRLKAILLVLVSSGLRLGEALQLRVSDVNTSGLPIEVRVRAENTKTREERFAYISSEAYKAIQPYLEGRNMNDYFLLRSNKYHENTTFQVHLRFHRLRKKLGLDARYSNGMYHINLHSFRAFFHTQATKVLGSDIAHAMIGHHTYLDQYFRLTREERAENYLKLEPYLTISQMNKLHDELARSKVQLQRQEYLENKLSELEAELKRLKARYE